MAKRRVFGEKMTSDGIIKKDWDKVHRLACRVVNATLREDRGRHRLWHKRLMDCLDRLEEKYGPLPSIIATRGDFGENEKQKVKCWKKAYALAESGSDDTNMFLIATSLSEFMIEEKQDAIQGRKWLKLMQSHLPLRDKAEVRHFVELRRRLTKLKEK